MRLSTAPQSTVRRVTRRVWRRLPAPAKRWVRQALSRPKLGRASNLEPATGITVEPLVSVVVASCNRSDLLRIALRSVQLQNIQAWECIVVDDDSTDDSVDISLQFAAVDPRFRVYVHDRRRGLSSVRNTGIAHARAPWVCFLDDDDLLLNGSLSARLRAVDGSDSDIIGSFADWINIDPEEGLEVFSPRRAPTRRGLVTFATLGAGVPFIATSPMLRTDALRQFGGFNEGVDYAEDAELWFRVLRAGYQFVDANHIGVAYRRTRGSIVTGAPDRQLSSLLEVMHRADRPDPSVVGPLPTTEPLPVVAAQLQRSPQLLRYLSMIAVADSPQRAVEIGLLEMLPIVRLTALRADQLLGQLVDYCMLRLTLDPSERAHVEAQVRRLIDGLEPVRSEVMTETPGEWTKRSQERAKEWAAVSRTSTTAADVILVPEAAYHVDELAPLVGALQRRGLSVGFMLSPKTVPAAERAIGSASHLVAEFDPEVVYRSRAVVVLNDWGPMQAVITEARRRGVATFGKVEGVQDFDDVESDWARRPYRSVEYVLAQGENDVQALPGAQCFVVGSSRLEKIWHSPLANVGEHAIVNLNFTYRVLTEHRDAWTKTVADALRATGVRAVVSRHPAERGKTAGLSVAKKPFRHEITSAGMLISRFSTVPFEAMARGVPFIYHNPCGERMPTFLGEHDEYWSSDSTASLVEAIEDVRSFEGDYRNLSEPFFRLQVDLAEVPSHERAADAIEGVLTERT